MKRFGGIVGNNSDDIYPYTLVAYVSRKWESKGSGTYIHSNTQLPTISE